MAVSEKSGSKQSLGMVDKPGGKKLGTLPDLCVSSLRRGHANLLCIVPILSDVPRRESSGAVFPTSAYLQHSNAKKNKKECAERIVPICTLSQNGYGAHCGSKIIIIQVPNENATPNKPPPQRRNVIHIAAISAPQQWSTPLSAEEQSLGFRVSFAAAVSAPWV